MTSVMPAISVSTARRYEETRADRVHW